MHLRVITKEIHDFLLLRVTTRLAVVEEQETVILFKIIKNS